MAELDALGFGKVEGTKNREDGHRRLDGRVGAVQVCQEKALQGKTIKMQPSPARETIPQLRADSIVLDLILASAVMAEPTAKGRDNLEAPGGSPAIEPAGALGGILWGWYLDSFIQNKFSFI